MTILSTILTAALMLNPSATTIETLDGTQYVGQLRALSAENAQIETPEGLKTIATDQLISVTLPQDDKAHNNLPEGKLSITLADGSTIAADDYRVEDATAKISIAGESKTITVPTRDVDAVRFKTLPPELKEAWEKLRKETAHNDRLIVAKGDSLDYHGGTLGNVTESRIVFSLDEKPLKIKREKVFAITYYHSAGRKLPKSVGQLETTNGARWTLVSVTMDGDRFHMKTPTGLERSFAANQIKCIRFAEGKIAYLSDLRPESVTWTPYLSTGSPAKTPGNKSRETLFGPKFNKSFQAGPLILSGKQYQKGLAIHSRSVITYRLDKKYGRLTAMAGIADRVRPQGNVQLIITADDRVLLDREISGTEEAIPLDLDLAQAKRLTITVDFGQQADIADRLIIGNAKVIE